MDPGRRVSFEKEYSSKVAAVLEQMKETLRRAGQVDDIEVREREREREENGERDGYCSSPVRRLTFESRELVTSFLVWSTLFRERSKR